MLLVLLFIGMTPAILFFIFSHSRLKTLGTILENTLGPVSRNLQTARTDNPVILSGYVRLQTDMKQLSENVPRLGTRAFAVIEKDLSDFEADMQSRIEVEGRLAADLVENFIGSSVRIRMADSYNFV